MSVAITLTTGYSRTLRDSYSPIVVRNGVMIRIPACQVKPGDLIATAAPEHRDRGNISAFREGVIADLVPVKCVRNEDAKVESNSRMEE